MATAPFRVRETAVRRLAAQWAILARMPLGHQLGAASAVAQRAGLADAQGRAVGFVMQDRRVRAQALYPVRGRLADDRAHVNTRRAGLAHLGIGFRKLQTRLVCCLLDVQRVML